MANLLHMLTHWGRVTLICVGNLAIICSDNGLSPGRPQAIIWTNAGILLIQTLGTNFSEILKEIYAFSFKKMHLKMSSGKCRPSCLGLNVLGPCTGAWFKFLVLIQLRLCPWRVQDTLNNCVHQAAGIASTMLGIKIQCKIYSLLTFEINSTYHTGRFLSKIDYTYKLIITSFLLYIVHNRYHMVYPWITDKLRKSSAVYSFSRTVKKCSVMWQGQSRVIFKWSLILVCT